MIQFTNTEQSAALIAGGAEKPVSIASVSYAGVIHDRRHYVNLQKAYSIGELMGMLPTGAVVTHDKDFWCVDVAGTKYYAVELVEALVAGVLYTWAQHGRREE